MLIPDLSARSALLAASAIVFSLSCNDLSETRGQPSDPEINQARSSSRDPVLVGAGDIAACESSGDEATARLLDNIPGTVFTAGDNAYLTRRMRNPFPCYNASWGRHKHRTRPVPGNHEYQSSHTADSYFDYFGDAAGERGKGYYSYDLGSWHIIALNTMVETDPRSSQGRWLSRDLAANRQFCTLAYFHHPRFSSGPHQTNPRSYDLWETLSAAGVDVVVSGHDHIYERFAPMTADGHRDDNTGMRQFVVGTGGYSHYEIEDIAKNSEIRNNSTYGVIKLTLRERGYDWQFVPVRGRSFTDTGSGRCH